MNRILLIDTANYMHRAYHALPKSFKDAQGNPTNAVYGFTSMLILALDTLKPTHAIAAIDGPEATFRDGMYALYKKNRKETDKELLEQEPKIWEIIDAFGIKRIAAESYEADDIIGTAAKQAEKKGFEVVIISNDRDILQLLSGHVRVFYPDGASKEGGEFFGVSDFKKKYGFEPVQMVEYKAIRGDLSDNIPGVPGIGEKGAADLVKEYKTLEGVYKHLDRITPASVKRKLEAGEDLAKLSKKLAKIETKVPLDSDPLDCRIKTVDRMRVAETFKKYNFKSLIKRLGYEIKPDGSIGFLTEVKKGKNKEENSAQLKML